MKVFWRGHSMRWVTIAAFGLLALLLVLAPAHLPASSGGITTFSGQFGPDCNACHSGGSIPTVTLGGPTSLAPGATGSFTLTITNLGISQRAGGLDVSADGGSFVRTDAGTRVEAGEIVHNSPRTQAGGQVVFSFDWVAPVNPGSYTIYGAGNAVNLAQATNGDAAGTDTLGVDVAAAATPGETSSNVLQPLLVTAYDKVTGDLTLSYQAACDSPSHNVYYGPLSQVSTHGWSGDVCDIGDSGSLTGFNPGSGSYFFVVVGNQGGDEGSYGTARDTGGALTERPDFPANLCGQIQTLADRCD